MKHEERKQYEGNKLMWKQKTSNLNIELYLYVLYINTTYSINDILKEIT